VCVWIELHLLLYFLNVLIVFSLHSFTYLLAGMYIMYIQLWHEAQPPKVPSAVARASVPTPYGTGFHSTENARLAKNVCQENKLSFQRTAETHVVPRPRIMDDETAAHR